MRATDKKLSIIYNRQILKNSVIAITQQTPPVKDGYIVRRGDTMTEIAVKTGQNLQELIKENPQIKNPNKIYIGQHINVGGRTDDYTVKRGDTLNEIAKDQKMSVGDILRATPGQIANRNLIYPGQKLHIPVHAGETPTAKTPTPKQTPTTETKLRRLNRKRRRANQPILQISQLRRKIPLRKISRRMSGLIRSISR